MIIFPLELNWVLANFPGETFGYINTFVEYFERASSVVMAIRRVMARVQCVKESNKLGTVPLSE